MDFELDGPTQALLSVAFISFAPVLCLLGLPVNNPVAMKRFLALAAGCLLADAFLHLIPESEVLLQSHSSDNLHHHHHHHHQDHHHELLGDHHHHHSENDREHSHIAPVTTHDHHHDHNHEHHHHDSTTGFRVLLGILIFFSLERVFYVFNPADAPEGKGSTKSKPKKKKDDVSHIDTDVHHHDHGHGHIHAFGILNLIADFLHNFTDGLAIGASFLTGTKLGISTTVAIFLHEIPHEISDYAILIQSGFSQTKAIWLQCVTAIGAISGTLVALYASHRDSNANAWILPITAGGFIYIAMVHLLPQLKSSNFKNTAIELIIFVFGVALMLGVSFIE